MRVGYGIQGKRLQRAALLLAGALIATIVLYLLLRGGVLELFGLAFGHDVSASHADVGAFAVLLAGAILLVSFYVFVQRRSHTNEEPVADGASTGADPDSPTDPVIQRMEWIFWRYVAALGVVIGITMLFGFGRETIELWRRHYPWMQLAYALGALVSIVDSIYVWRAKPKPLLTMLNQACQSLVVVLAIVAFAAVVLTWIYDGLMASSQAFSRAPRATQIALFAMPAAFLAFVLLMLLRYAYAGQRVRVFISFHNSREAVASALERALGDAGLIVRRIPFRGDYEHDSLLQTIQDEIRHCDAMVCLPGARPSFVENEVLVASTLRKFIIFLVGEADPRLPNTAYYGYPVFRLERVQRLNYAPMSQLVLLVAGNWKVSLRYFLDSWSRLIGDGKTLLRVSIAFVAGTYLVGGAIAFATAGIAEVKVFVLGFHRAYLDLLGGGVLAWIWLNVFLVGCVFALINQSHTRRVLRQEILTGHLTHQVLRERLPGRKALRILACLWEKPPSADHEVLSEGNPDAPVL
jgi:hypothetical protein